MLVTLMLNNNLDFQLEFNFALFSSFKLFTIHTLSCLSCGFGVVIYFLLVLVIVFKFCKLHIIRLISILYFASVLIVICMCARFFSYW